MSIDKSTKHQLCFVHWILSSQHLGGKSLIGWLEILPLIWPLTECYGIVNKNTPPKTSNINSSALECKYCSSGIKVNIS